MQERQASWPCLTVRGCDHLAKSRAPALPYAILFSSRRVAHAPETTRAFEASALQGQGLSCLSKLLPGLSLFDPTNHVPAPLRPVFQRHLPNEAPRVPRDIALAPQA